MPAPGQNGISGRLVAKLVVSLDSPNDADAAAALCRLRSILKKTGKPFYEIVQTEEYKKTIWETFQPDCLRQYFETEPTVDSDAEELRNQLEQGSAENAELKKRLEESERDGAEIARRAQQIIEDLRLENSNSEKADDLCYSCEIKRRCLALAAGGFFLPVWFHIYPPDEANLEVSLLGFCVALSPLLAVFCYWHWLLFKRRYTWIAWNDNDIYRDIAQRWNGVLESARLR